MSTATLHNEKKKTLVPQLRFQEFDGEFVYRKLGDVCNIIMGQSPDSKSYNENGEGYYLIQGNADIKNRVSSPRQWTSMPTKICEIGDIILTVRAPVGAVAKSNHNACIGRGVCVIRNLGKYDLEYIYQFLLDFETKWGKLEQGSTFTAVSGADIKSIKSAFPTLPEQQKIASFLSSVDEKIQQLTRKATLLEQYKKGVMQQLFSGKLRFKDDSGKDYPNWEEKMLGEVCTFFSGGTPTSTNQKYYSGKIPFIGSGNIYDSEVFSFITEEALNNSSAKIIKKGDLLYALYGANSGEVSISKMEGAINQAVLCIRNKESIEYLYYVLLSNKDKIVAKFIQGGQGNLSSQIIKRLKYNFPCLKEQQKIANFLSGIDSKIEMVNQQLAQTQTFKKGLLQQMFV